MVNDAGSQRAAPREAARPSNPSPTQTQIRLHDLPPEFTAKPNVRSVIAMVGIWTFYAAVVAVALHFREWPVWLAAVFIIGALQHHMFNIGHEGVHGMLFRHRGLNQEATRWLLAGPTGLRFSEWRVKHFFHHGELGHRDDPDAQYYAWRERRNRRLRFLGWLALSFCGGAFLSFAGRATSDSELIRRLQAFNAAHPRERIKDFASVVVAQLVIGTALWATSGHLWTYLVLWFLPVVTTAFGLVSLRQCLEHTDVLEDVAQTKVFSFASNPIERSFLSPKNMNYHYEHHRFIQVPCWRLPELRAFLQARGDYDGGVVVSSYAGQLRRMWRHMPW